MQDDLQTFLFVGLGNPGPKYENTRHNLGACVVQEFAHRLGWSLKEDRRFNAKIAKGISDHYTVHLMLPMTFMNLSGSAVKPYTHYFKIPLNRLVVVLDDISLAFGQLRLRAMGSTGGHNGLKSIEQCLGTSHYLRLRMGIGHPGEAVLANYVLESFNQAEQQELSVFIDRGVQVLQRLLKEDFTHVMNSVNTVPGQAQKQAEPEPKDLTKPPVAGRGE
jgi:PTH1 family peptidyl-tRNA hydrolase